MIMQLYYWQYADGVYGAALPLSGIGFRTTLGSNGRKWGSKAVSYAANNSDSIPSEYLKNPLMQNPSAIKSFSCSNFNYIHHNPVSDKWNLVNDYTDYKHSSASFYDLGIVRAYKPFDFRVL